jgi:hypothetical protein
MNNEIPNLETRLKNIEHTLQLILQYEQKTARARMYAVVWKLFLFFIFFVLPFYLSYVFMAHFAESDGLSSIMENIQNLAPLIK